MTTQDQPDSQPSSSWNRLRNASQNQTQVVAVIILFVVVTLILGGLYLAQSATSITTVKDIESLTQQRNRLERDNERLKADIARAQSIENRLERAATLGFLPAAPNDIIYLAVDGYVYNRPTEMPTLVAETATPADYEENFAGWLKNQFDQLRDQFSDWAP
jgi:hypothetical protein